MNFNSFNIHNVGSIRASAFHAEGEASDNAIRAASQQVSHGELLKTRKKPANEYDVNSGRIQISLKNKKTALIAANIIKPDKNGVFKLTLRESLTCTVLELCDEEGLPMKDEKNRPIYVKTNISSLFERLDVKEKDQKKFRQAIQARNRKRHQKAVQRVFADRGLDVKKEKKMDKSVQLAEDSLRQIATNQILFEIFENVQEISAHTKPTPSHTLSSASIKENPIDGPHPASFVSLEDAGEGKDNIHPAAVPVKEEALSVSSPVEKKKKGKPKRSKEFKFGSRYEQRQKNSGDFSKPVKEKEKTGSTIPSASDAHKALMQDIKEAGKKRVSLSASASPTKKAQTSEAIANIKESDKAETLQKEVAALAEKLRRLAEKEAKGVWIKSIASVMQAYCDEYDVGKDVRQHIKSIDNVVLRTQDDYMRTGEEAKEFAEIIATLADLKDRYEGGTIHKKALQMRPISLNPLRTPEVYPNQERVLGSIWRGGTEDEEVSVLLAQQMRPKDLVVDHAKYRTIQYKRRDLFEDILMVLNSLKGLFGREADESRTKGKEIELIRDCWKKTNEKSLRNLADLFKNIKGEIESILPKEKDPQRLRVNINKVTKVINVLEKAADIFEAENGG